MNPLHRTDSHIYTIKPIDEEQLYEDVRKLYKEIGKISTLIIVNKFDVDFSLALKMMARVINED